MILVLYFFSSDLNVPLNQDGKAVEIIYRILLKSIKGPKAGSYNFTMSNGDKFNGSVKADNISWGYETMDDPNNRFHSVGTSKSNKISNGTAFGKDVSGITALGNIISIFV